jgi:hypothetical protein
LAVCVHRGVDCCGARCRDRPDFYGEKNHKKLAEEGRRSGKRVIAMHPDGESVVVSPNGVGGL